MHNRVRMVVASFLVKDLHVAWQHGARFFLRHLRDGDLASNNHGWQWAAGTGTDAAPYLRVFNPVSQGLKFDPDGDYVRRYVPELRGLREGRRTSRGRRPSDPCPATRTRSSTTRPSDARRWSAIRKCAPGEPTVLKPRTPDDRLRRIEKDRSRRARSCPW